MYLRLALTRTSMIAALAITPCPGRSSSALARAAAVKDGASAPPSGLSLMDASTTACSCGTGRDRSLPPPLNRLAGTPLKNCQPAHRQITRAQTCALTQTRLRGQREASQARSASSRVPLTLRCQSPALRYVQKFGKPIRHQVWSFDAAKCSPQSASALKHEGLQ